MGRRISDLDDGSAGQGCCVCHLQEPAKVMMYAPPMGSEMPGLSVTRRNCRCRMLLSVVMSDASKEPLICDVLVLQNDSYSLVPRLLYEKGDRRGCLSSLLHQGSGPSDMSLLPPSVSPASLPVPEHCVFTTVGLLCQILISSSRRGEAPSQRLQLAPFLFHTVGAWLAYPFLLLSFVSMLHCCRDD